jgi:hypothetical protein
VKTDAISIVEAAYNCEGDARAWLGRLLEIATPKVDRGFGVAITTHSPNMRPEDSLSKGDLSGGADAVLSPSGSVAHAEVGAQSLSARESLRAAKAIDRARSKARGNEDEALRLFAEALPSEPSEGRAWT